MSFAEVVVAMVVMLLAVSIFSSTVVSTARQRNINRERALAADAASGLFEEMRNEDFNRVYALYNADPQDDPNGPGTAPGHLFAIAGLNVIPGSPGGVVGQIIFPELALETSPPTWELRENLNHPQLGMPRDINGDEIVDGLDHRGDYTILPVQIVVNWRGVIGEQHISQFTILTELAL
jgi:hypothetical protein